MTLSYGPDPRTGLKSTVNISCNTSPFHICPLSLSFLVPAAAKPRGSGLLPFLPLYSWVSVCGWAPRERLGCAWEWGGGWVRSDRGHMGPKGVTVRGKQAELLCSQSQAEERQGKAGLHVCTTVHMGLLPVLSRQDRETRHLGIQCAPAPSTAPGGLC